MKFEEMGMGQRILVRHLALCIFLGSPVLGDSTPLLKGGRIGDGPVSTHLPHPVSAVAPPGLTGDSAQHLGSQLGNRMGLLIVLNLNC